MTLAVSAVLPLVNDKPPKHHLDGMGTLPQRHRRYFRRVSGYSEAAGLLSSPGYREPDEGSGN